MSVILKFLKKVEKKKKKKVSQTKSLRNVLKISLHSNA